MIKKPSLWLHLTEGIRSTFEFIHCLFFLAFYSYSVKGDLRPVMVVPGFLTNDFSTTLMRHFIRKSGFTVYGWDLGTNLGNLEDLKTLSARLDSIHQKHQRKVTLIGWSLGGIYVRELAKEKPQLVEQVITMGSPFAEPDAPNRAVWVYNLFNDFEKIDHSWKAQVPNPAPVRTTAIYSKKDGIVPWEACREKQEDALHQNIEVKCSHVGLPVCPAVLRVIAKRLQA